MYHFFAGIFNCSFAVNKDLTHIAAISVVFDFFLLITHVFINKN